MSNAHFKCSRANDFSLFCLLLLYQIQLNSHRMVKLGGVRSQESGVRSQEERELQR
ncbi:MAG: hypothetical protein F6K18_17405 [Okeania sp. SIO2C2]|nr:hypothetical protein [Okeania sp. SIO2C2]